MIETDNSRRNYERRTVLVEARLMEGGQWRECRILNISAGGAKLLAAPSINGEGMPALLEIGSFGQFGCAVVRQNGEEVAVKFTHDPAEMQEVVMGLAMYG